MSELGSRIGMAMTVSSFGSLGGPPIAGAIIHSGGFHAAGYFAGKYDCMLVDVPHPARYLTFYEGGVWVTDCLFAASRSPSQVCGSCRERPQVDWR